MRVQVHTALNLHNSVSRWKDMRRYVRVAIGVDMHIDIPMNVCVGMCKSVCWDMYVDMCAPMWDTHCTLICGCCRSMS